MALRPSDPKIIGMRRAYANALGIVLILPAIWASGCQPVPPAAEPVRLDLAGVKPSADVSDLAAVLSAAVRQDGRVNPDGLKQSIDRLDAQLKLLAVSGPTATPPLYPTAPARQAYWLNARAAWSLKLAALAGCPERVEPEKFMARPFTLDGRILSLAAIDQALLAETRNGDFRVAAAAPGVRVDDAPLPATPYEAGKLRQQAAEMFTRLMADGRRVVLDIDTQQLRLPPMLWACREGVLAEYRARYGGAGQATLLTALLALVDEPARRRLTDAVGYEVVAQPVRTELAVPKKEIYFPGKVGKIEP